MYFEPGMQWYVKDSDRVFKPTTAEKLANLYRGLMMNCGGTDAGECPQIEFVQ